MPRLAWVGPLLVLSCLPRPGRCDDQPRPADVQALQDLIQKTIEKAEPSVACILVSRSDDYRRFDTVPPDPGAGKLGRFSPPPGYSRPIVPAFNETEKDREMRRLVQSLDLSGPDVVPESFGSGVVMDAEQGLVLTMAHVVRDATKIYVRLPGGGSWANIYAADPRSDLAVLSLIDKVPKLRALKRGDGSHLKKGQFVICLANPFAAGFRDGSPSASWGIVSNLHRRASGVTSELGERPGSKPTLHYYGTLVQTDVRLALGSSGGALLNLDGELIGLTTAQAALAGSEAPGGYAVPLDGPMTRIIDVLMRGDEVEYGFLGVVFDKDVRTDRGVMIRGVAAGSPAAAAGLATNDVITAINGNPIHDNDDLYLQIGLCLAGGTARIEATVGPGGPRKTCTAVVAKSYTPGNAIASHRPDAVGGLRVDYTSILTQRLGLQEIPPGVAIREVGPDSPADKARLQVDYVITRVNGRPVNSPAEFYDAMEKARAAGTAELTVRNPEDREDRVTLNFK